MIIQETIMNLHCHETLIPYIHTYIHIHTHTRTCTRTHSSYKSLYYKRFYNSFVYIYIYFSSNTLHYGTYFITDIFCNICSAACTKRCLWEVNRIRCTTGMCKFVDGMEVKERNWPCVNATAGQSQ